MAESVAPSARPTDAAAPRPRLILASTSAYRRELLARLRLAFDVASPDVDETPRAGEAPAVLAARLALAKAHAVAATLARGDDAVVVGADQVADLDGRPLGKPGARAPAIAQLRAMRGRAVAFHTAFALLRPATGLVRVGAARAVVRLRADLGDDAIARYVDLERPYDCAGAAKVETLGIALAEAIDSDDPTGLIGLPLIRLAAALRDAGLDPLGGDGPTAR